MTPPGEPNLLKQLDYSVLQQCMHCGMCLPTCPTYDQTGLERNSPRGRIALMRAVADDRIAVDRDFADEFSYCVGCLACQSACPAGVNYAPMLEASRAECERKKIVPGFARSWTRWLAMRVLFMRPRLLRLVGRALYVCQRPWLRGTAYRIGLMRLLPRRLRELEPQAPTMAPPFSDARIRAVESPPDGQKRYRVGLLTGCVHDLAYAGVNRATADVLLANGCEVVTPRRQPCCGSLHAHNGDPESARELARRLIDAFDATRLDAIVSNAGGCGSHLKHYGRVLQGDASYAERAAQWDRKARDIHEWLVEVGYRRPTAAPAVGPVAYDASCHLCHGQGVRAQPIDVLRSIPGLTLVELPESEWCCGSAGIYSITQPESAAELLERKLKNIVAAGAQVIATGNPGCLLQLAGGVRNHPGLSGVRVVHPIELLAQAYAAE
ncbi:Lactate utilization protein A [Pirellulimonas nuda]|uniref:Glycolate oxidase iron-sulfur subunit n=1 Tax=Pirellulimonas nuda TaxID=2528009 RepID=A0A518DAK7_9BACT|nr:heterodisulfide reductase-related iron-sulfur binding cluster [Pirellulimonas nuda]QDU88515.1 Lactate utilization protein A [Pirellulimonas nuda]